MTDRDEVCEQLERLALGETPPAWSPGRTIERAVHARDDVEAAAAFASDGGRERLAAAVEAAERTPEADRAAEGRSVLAAFHRFEAACRGGARPPSGGTGTAAEDRSGPLPPRSRNP